MAWSGADGQKSGIDYIIDCISFTLPKHSVKAVTNQTSIVLKDLILSNCYICTLLARNNIGDSPSLSLFIAAGNSGHSTFKIRYNYNVDHLFNPLMDNCNSFISDYPHQCCHSPSNPLPSNATSTTAIESKITVTLTSPTINIQTTVPIKTQPTTISTSVPNQSTVDSSSTVIITATQTTSNLLNTTTVLLISPTSNHGNLPGKGKNDP